MIISETGVEFVKQAEGFTPMLVDDVGHPMIGYGCDLTPEEARHYAGLTIPETDADAMLRARLGTISVAVTDIVKVNVTQAAFDALCSFAFNLGVTTLRESTLMRKLNDGDYQGAALQFTRWDHAGGKVLSGLHARRIKEMTMFLSNRVPNEPVDA